MNTTSISSRELLDSNTLARGLAIWAVVACHIPDAHAFWAPISVFASAGKLSVSVFLFSSGLLLQHQVNRAGGKLQLSTWLKKRFLRVYPLYWIGLALALFCAWAFRGRIYGAGILAANILGIPVWIHLPVVSSGYAVTFWFISLLLLCYVLFLFVHGVRRKGFLVGGALLLSFAGLRGGHFMGAPVLAFPSFFMGMFMADRLQRRGGASSDVRIHAAVFLPLLGILAFVFKHGYFMQIDARYSIWLEALGCAGLTAIALPVLYMVAYVQKTVAGISPAVLRGLLWVAGPSFAVYCIHEPLLVVIEKSTEAGHPWSGLLVYVLVTLLTAWGLDALDKRLKRMLSPGRPQGQPCGRS